jgi:uncharacterized protein (TIGR02996 family)
MATEEEFLAAIEANHDDDAPRLAHADWLENNGDPERAEFIRLQVADARRPWGADRQERRDRIKALLEAHRSRWLGRRPKAGALSWNFVRGYPEELEYRTFNAFSSTWRRALSFPVRWVRFYQQFDLDRLPEEPGLAQVRRLYLSHRERVHDDTLRAILESPHLGPLEGLHVYDGRLTGASMALVASSPKLAGLRELILWNSWGSDYEATPDDIGGLLASSNVAALRVLTLDSWSIAGEGCRLLWAARLPQLRSLRLWGSAFGGGGLVWLGDGGRMPALEHLDLGSNDLLDDDVEALARATAWTHLRVLDLYGNLIGERGTRALAAAPQFRRLERLVLERNTVGDGGAEALASSQNLAALESLDLEGCLIGDAGMTALGRSTSLPALTELVTTDVAAFPALADSVSARFRERRPPLAIVTAAPAHVAPVATAGDADEDGLVRALLADPRDPLARSGYADWLEEHGKPLHAELVRLRPDWSPRIKDILNTLRSAIAAVFGKLEPLPVAGEDGLVVVPMKLGDFLKKGFQSRAAEAARSCGVVGVEITGGTKDWSKLDGLPALGHLRVLRLGRSTIRADGAEALARCRSLGAVSSLSVRGARLGGEGVAALCRSEGLARLVHLDLPRSAATPATMRALASGPLAGRLRHLNATDGRMGDEGMAALLSSPTFLAPLTTLTAPGSHTGTRAVCSLAEAPLSALRNLDLSRNHIEQAGFDALASSGWLRNLRRLKLVIVSLVPAHLARLVRAVAAVPGLTLVLHKDTPMAAAGEFRAALGERLILES